MEKTLLKSEVVKETEEYTIEKSVFSDGSERVVVKMRENKKPIKSNPKSND